MKNTEILTPEKPFMGLTTFKGELPCINDIKIAKNYLKEMELADMGQLVNGVLELAERMAKRHIPMTMEGRAKQIDTILAAGGNEVLQTAGSVSSGISNFTTLVAESFARALVGKRGKDPTLPSLPTPKLCLM